MSRDSKAEHAYQAESILRAVSDTDDGVVIALEALTHAVLALVDHESLDRVADLTYLRDDERWQL